jgi:hypothetical protein
VTSPYEKKGDNLVVRRIATLIVTCGLVLGLGLTQIFGQDQAKKETAPAAPGDVKAAPKTDAGKPAEPAKDKAAEKKDEAPKATEPPLPEIPKEVQDKIDAARRAVAEAIVAAQDAGLVETSIDPPPILDILVTGRATDARTLKSATAKKPFGVTPEVFAAWYTGYGAPAFESVDYVKDVRIVRPSDGLKAFFDQRAAILRNEIAEVRKTKPKPPEKKDETKAVEKKADSTKPADAEKGTPKPEEPKKDQPTPKQ